MKNRDSKKEKERNLEETYFAEKIKLEKQTKNPIFIICGEVRENSTSTKEEQDAIFKKEVFRKPKELLKIRTMVKIKH